MSTAFYFPERSPRKVLLIGGEVIEGNFFIIQALVDKNRNILGDRVCEILVQLNALFPILVPTPIGRSDQKKSDNIFLNPVFRRSEERRVGKECRARAATCL